MKDMLETTSPVVSDSRQTTSIAVAHGDGIGPEIMDATLRILKAAGTKLEFKEVVLGESLYKQGFSSGMMPETWDVLRETKVLLKAPITTPQGGGVKSLNVTLRKTLGLYANVRPCVTYHPFVTTQFPGMDIVIVRENEEDLYAGIEHRQTDDTYQCLKLVTRAGCERIVRYAFEYAKANKRNKVTCMTKDNIMKLTDGLFHKVFDEIGMEYPEIEKEHWIIDIGVAKVATQPTSFDVIVTPNLYGDIISDVAAEVAGTVGMAPSANIGAGYAMFEAIHGSAPSIAGQNIANPSGLLLSAVMMLIHIGQPEIAAKIHNAWLRTLEDGVHTGDIYDESVSKQKVGTKEFADAVIERLGQNPERLVPVSYQRQAALRVVSEITKLKAEKQTVGIDVFVEWNGSTKELAEKLSEVRTEHLQLQMITNRGVMVWPKGFPDTITTDHWRCRFVSGEYKAVCLNEMMSVLSAVAQEGVSWVKTETLCTFDGEPGFSLGQGQ